MEFFRESLKNKIAIIYTRVSTEDQADRGYSLPAQEEQLRAWCKRYNINIIQHFKEDGASAKTFDRPQFNILSNFIKNNKATIDFLLVVKWDRFSRNMEQALSKIKQFKKLGIIVNATDQWIDYEDPNHALMLAIHLATPQVENDVRSNRTTIGMRRAAKEGRWMAKAPKGYKFIPDGLHKSKLVPNEDAQFIEEAFQEVQKGEPLENVRKKLYSKGFKTSSSNFHRIIRNPVYMGKVRIQAYKNEPEQIVDGLHESIISEEQFFKAQKALKNLRKTRIRKVENLDIFVLRGFLYCIVCDNPLTSGFGQSHTGKKFPYYYCQKARHNNLRADHTNEEFISFLSSLTIPKGASELYQNVLSDIFKNDSNEKKSLLKKLTQKIEELEANEMKTELKFINDEINKETFDRIKSLYSKELKERKRELAEVESIETNYEKYLSFGFSVLSQFDNCYKLASYEEKRSIIGLIIGKKIYFDKKNYQTTNDSPIQTLNSIFCNGLESIKKGKSDLNLSLFPFGDPNNNLAKPGLIFKAWFDSKVFQSLSF